MIDDAKVADHLNNLGTTQELQKMMVDGNRAAMKRLRSVGDGLDGERCIAKPVFTTHADTAEQTFRNQEMLAQIMLRRREHILAPPKPSNGWAFLWLAVTHPVIYRLIALVAILSILAILLHVVGVLNIPFMAKLTLYK